MSDPVAIAVLIPALDEEATLPGVIAEIPRSGSGFTVREIVVVDNGSRDRTAAVARGAGVTVVTEPRRGYGAACLAGLAVLGARPPAIVAFMDADGSDEPRELPALLAPLLERRADLVIGSRVLGAREPGSLTPLQFFGNSLATTLIGLLFGVRFTDLGPFRAVGWPTLEALRMRDRDFGWTMEMQARAAKAGRRCIEVPVSYRRRRLGKSKVAGTLRGTLGASWKILFTLVRVRLGG